MEILHALAQLYRRSTAGRRGGERDFTIDYETLLRRAGLADGDAREIAEQDLAAAEQLAAGALQIDRHPRSAALQRVRLRADGGEAWLFGRLNQERPQASRAQLADFFQQAATQPVPEPAAWQRWLAELAQAAMAGDSVQPFSREDPAGNQELLTALLGVLRWPHESLIRYASVQITGDSKSLERLRPRLEMALRAITGDPHHGLEQRGLLEVPRMAWLHGPMVLEFPDTRLDLRCLSAALALSAADLSRCQLRLHTPLVLTVENESVFHELCRRQPGVLLIQTSFPGAATRLLFEKLPTTVTCLHFGDTDPAGFDILRDLRERSGREIHPLWMEPKRGERKLTAQGRKVLARLLETPSMHDLAPRLSELAAWGCQGEFEQEALPLDEVLAALERWRR